MMNAFTYFLTAISEIKKSKFSQDPSTYELAKITSEFETVVEAGSKLPYKPAKVFVYGNLTEWLVSIVHESVVEKKRFPLELVPQSDGTFAVSPYLIKQTIF